MSALATFGVLDKALDVAGKLDLWHKVQAKLLGDPGLAAKNLAFAIREVRKTFTSLRDTILEITYLGVPGQEDVDVRRSIDRIELGQLGEGIVGAKGDCGRIKNIYDNHLDAWFNRLLNRDEAAELKELFDDLSNSDGWVIRALEELVYNAKPLVREIRGLLDAGKKAEAQQRAEAFGASLRPRLESLSRTVQSMLELEVKLIQGQRLTEHPSSG